MRAGEDCEHETLKSLYRENNARNMDIKEFPFLTSEEFAEVCHYFDSQYCRAKLGPIRKKWKFRLCTALDLTYSTRGGYITYIQIIRPLEETVDPNDISLDLGNFSISDHDEQNGFLQGDDDMIDDEESDAVCQFLILLLHVEHILTLS
jgi:ubiquitin-like-conjugating enzyme ATG10